MCCLSAALGGVLALWGIQDKLVACMSDAAMPEPSKQKFNFRRSITMVGSTLLPQRSNRR